MKKIILLLAFVFMITVLVGCNNSQPTTKNNNEIIYSSDRVSDIVEKSTISTEAKSIDTSSNNDDNSQSDTDAERTTAVQCPNEQYITEQQNYGYEGIELSDVSIVSEYEIDVYCDMIINKWDTDIKAQNLNLPTGYSLMGEYVFIEKMPQEYLNQTDYIIMSENDFCVLYDVHSEGNPLMFIYDEDLYIYDHYLKNGIIHSAYVIYDLTTEKLEKVYVELYNLGDSKAPFDVIAENSHFDGFEDVAEDIRSKTSTLYQIHYTS